MQNTKNVLRKNKYWAPVGAVVPMSSRRRHHDIAHESLINMKWSLHFLRFKNVWKMNSLTVEKITMSVKEALRKLNEDLQ